jgi:hypothetical protein
MGDERTIYIQTGEATGHMISFRLIILIDQYSSRVLFFCWGHIQEKRPGGESPGSNRPFVNWWTGHKGLEDSGDEPSMRYTDGSGFALFMKV